MVVELFEGGWLELGEGLPHAASDCGPSSCSSCQARNSGGQASG